MQSDSQIHFIKDDVSSTLRIAPIILTVFVENAFKHSQASQTEKVRINIFAKVEDEKLIFVCENTNTQQSNVDKLAQGIGLENVKSKLRLIYPNRHQLLIDKTENWFRVSLKIELITCIIIEDQEPSQLYIKDTAGVDLLQTFSNAIKALTFLKSTHVDLIFLEIHLPKLSGMDFLAVLSLKPKVILTTVFSEYALQSYDYDVVDYLLKPFSFDPYVRAVYTKNTL